MEKYYYLICTHQYQMDKKLFTMQPIEKYLAWDQFPEMSYLLQKMRLEFNIIVYFGVKLSL